MSEKPKFIAIQSTRNQDTFWIHWNLSKRCNYNCSYCSDALHDMTSPHHSLEYLVSVANKINKADELLYDANEIRKKYESYNLDVSIGQSDVDKLYQIDLNFYFNKK